MSTFTDIERKKNWKKLTLWVKKKSSSRLLESKSKNVTNI